MISFRPFRELMKKRSISTYFLRNKCGEYNLDSKTIQRLMTDQSVSTNTIDSLCQIFGCGFDDIMEILPDPPKTEEHCTDCLPPKIIPPICKNSEQL